MGVYIKNWSIANWKELLKWAKIGANNAVIGEFTEVEEVPPHGRLIDADALYEMCVLDTSTDVMASAKRINEYMQLKIDDAPTIIEAEER